MYGDADMRSEQFHDLINNYSTGALFLGCSLNTHCSSECEEAFTREKRIIQSSTLASSRHLLERNASSSRVPKQVQDDQLSYKETSYDLIAAFIINKDTNEMNYHAYHCNVFLLVVKNET